jgi:dephospho-CoA kinase
MSSNTERPFVIGLTGSIGMGKSTVASMFKDEGVPVHDADAVVHALYRGRAVGPVEAAFPGVTHNGEIDRTRLSAQLKNDPGRFQILESIVHPLVREEEETFLSHAKSRGEPVVLVDIPLLFETRAQDRFDLVVVVSAPEAVQRARVLAREGMTAERFAAIVLRQHPDAKKRHLADAVIDTGLSLDETRQQVRALLARIRQGEFDARDRTRHGNDRA